MYAGWGFTDMGSCIVTCFVLRSEMLGFPSLSGDTCEVNVDLHLEHKKKGESITCVNSGVLRVVCVAGLGGIVIGGMS